MATIQAGGGRRSTAPTYTPYSPLQSQALVADPELLRRQIFESATTDVLGDAYVGNNAAESWARGNSVLTGQGSDASTNSSPGTSMGNTGDGPGFSQSARGLGFGMSALGSLAKDGALAQAGGLVGTVGALAGARTPGDVAMAVGPALTGVPGAAMGIARAAINGDVALGVNSALSLANPALGLANAVSSVLGIGDIGTFAQKMLAKYGIAMAEHNPENAARGYGEGFGDNSFGGFGVDGTDSFQGGSNSGRNGGGYGGGIGQSGGNASGVGSSQA